MYTDAPDRNCFNLGAGASLQLSVVACRALSMALATPAADVPSQSTALDFHLSCWVADTMIKAESTLSYPPLPFQLKPGWYHELPESYRHILDEVYQALDNALFFLASTGTRTALDLLCIWGSQKPHCAMYLKKPPIIDPTCP